MGVNGQEVKSRALICPLFQAVAADQGRGDPGHNVGQGQHLRHHRLLRCQQDRHEPGTGGYNITRCPVLGHYPFYLQFYAIYIKTFNLGLGAKLK